MSLPKNLSTTTLATLIERVDATEVHGEDGGPYLTLNSPFSPDPVGEMRVFTSASVPKIVYAGLTVDKFNMDTHMIFGFAPEESGVPHFTLDSVNANGTLAFHLDLIPRTALATHVPYMDHTYGGLSEVYAETSKWEGLTPAHITPRQYAMMSPWMLVNRASDEETFKAIGGPVSQYLDHWLGLIEKGLPEEISATLADADLPDHDAKLRFNLFSPEVDPVWRDVAKIVGDDASEKMRLALTSNAI
jgi:hypothetical protein